MNNNIGRGPNVVNSAISTTWDLCRQDVYAVRDQYHKERRRFLVRPLTRTLCLCCLGLVTASVRHLLAVEDTCIEWRWQGLLRAARRPETVRDVPISLQSY